MPSIDATTEFAQQLGRQLRQAREAAGLSTEAVCAQLKLHIGIVQALESGNWDRLGAPVYVRGQLRSYGQLLGVSLGGADEHFARLQQRISAQPAGRMVQAPLLPRERSSRVRPLLYGLGGALLAAAMWALVHWYLADAEPVAASLNIPQVLEPPSAAPLPLAALPMPAPPLADMAAADTPTDADAPLPEQEIAPVAAEAAVLTLRARADSWVEAYAPGGRVVEQTLLRAGDVRHFRRGQLGRVVIGNADVVDVLRGGVIQDTSPFRRANVARFAVSLDGAITRTPN